MDAKNVKFEMLNESVNDIEERIKRIERELLSKKLQYENYKSVDRKQAYVIENLVKDIMICEKAIKELNEEIWELLNKAQNL